MHVSLLCACSPCHDSKMTDYCSRIAGKLLHRAVWESQSRKCRRFLQLCHPTRARRARMKDPFFSSCRSGSSSVLQQSATHEPQTSNTLCRHDDASCPTIQGNPINPKVCTPRYTRRCLRSTPQLARGVLCIKILVTKAPWLLASPIPLHDQRSTGPVTTCLHVTSHITQTQSPLSPLYLLLCFAALPPISASRAFRDVGALKRVDIRLTPGGLSPPLLHPAKKTRCCRALILPCQAGHKPSSRHGRRNGTGKTTVALETRPRHLEIVSHFLRKRGKVKHQLLHLPPKRRSKKTVPRYREGNKTPLRLTDSALEILRSEREPKDLGLLLSSSSCGAPGRWSGSQAGPPQVVQGHKFYRATISTRPQVLQGHKLYKTTGSTRQQSG